MGFEQVLGTDDVTYVSDSTALLGWLSAGGHASMPIADAVVSPPPAMVLVMTDDDLIAEYGHARGLRSRFARSRTGWVPATAFDASPEAVQYTLSQLQQCDFEDAARRASESWERLETVAGALHFVGEATDLVCELSDSPTIAARTTMSMASGEWLSIPQCFEIETGAISSALPDYSISGVLGVEGMLAAKNVAMPAELIDKHRRARDLVREVMESRETIVMELESNRVVKVESNGFDMREALRELTNPYYDLNVLEFAIGLNASVLASIDWTVNSVANEGALGLHVALGDGITGAHVDFISTDAQWVAG